MKQIALIVIFIMCFLLGVFMPARIWSFVGKISKWFLFLLIPAIIASFFGTTGAIVMGCWFIAGAMLLIGQRITPKEPIRQINE